MKMFLVFVILVHASQHASGVEVYEGAESVLLPFHIERLPGRIKVLWIRCDLNPSTIHRLQAKEEHYVQNKLYINRTSMSKDSLRTGDYSLTLKKPRLSDSGKYTCIIFKGGKEAEQRDVELEVKESHTATIVLICVEILLVLLLLGAVSAGLYLWYNTIPVSQVVVNQGKGTVKLPFKTKEKMTEGATVEWSRCGPQATIHVYPNVSEPLLNNSETYDRRTNMNRDPLKTGNLSLTLSNPCLSDSGFYICTVQGDGNILAQKVVRLMVNGTKKKVVVKEGEDVMEESEKSFRLSFKTKAKLDEGVTVEWKRSEPEAMIVHVYEKGEHRPEKQDENYRGRTQMNNGPLQSKDLGVIIFHPGFSDSGTYICTVHKDGKVLACTEKQIQVKSLHEVVEVSELEKSFTLPFRTEDQLNEGATVEWRRSEPEAMIVHVYENSEHHPEKQDAYYLGRTGMDDDPLRTKDLRLNIYNPSFSDRGTYICSVSKDGTVLARKEVLVRFKVIQEVAQEVVEVEEGKKSFMLPFKPETEDHLPQDATVMWTRSEREAMKVHVYENSEDKREKQHEYYHGRTNMEVDPLQTKDLSLTISYPGFSDRGTYICTVSKDGKVLARKGILLRIKGVLELVEVREWEKSFTLPFRTEDLLPEDATVMWRRLGAEPMIVHVYENSEDKPRKQDAYYRGRTQMIDDPLGYKNLSLTISNREFRDRGTYICTVHKDGKVLARKEVQLRVRA